MRRIAIVSVLLAALAVPAAALALKEAPGDGSLVVKNGAAPSGTPVVALRITGSVIGELRNQGRIVIDAGPTGPIPEVTGAGAPRSVPTDKDGTAQAWASPDGFKFRAVGGTFTILIYGSGVNLVALGKGWVKLAGWPDTPVGDGRYSLNGDDFRSLPGQQSDRLYFPANG